MDVGATMTFRRPAVVDLIVPALLVALQLALFGPHTIYSGNQAEFNAPFWALERHLLLPTSFILVTLVGLGMCLSGGWRRAYVALLFSIGILLWVQANLLVASYGPLDGTEIDWSAQGGQNSYELGLWLAVPLLAVVAAKRIAPVAAFGSAVLMGLQLALLLNATLRAEPAARNEWAGPSDSMFEVSSTQNALHIVLDAFHSDVFSEILDAERAPMDRDFSGFVFFEDHAGAFPTTLVSIPAMLTGTTYRQEEPLQKYIRNHFEKGSLFRTLRANGYRVDNITGIPFDNKGATNRYRIFRPYVGYEAYTRHAAWELADLSLFRHAPGILRPWINNDQEWRLQNWFGSYETGEASGGQHHAVNGAAVLDDFAHRMSVATDRPLYKFIHVGIPHLPVAVNADCEFNGVLRYNRETFRAQATCAVRRVAAILNRLRELGVYDEALIVVSSDHGLPLSPRQFAHDRAAPDGDISAIAGKAMALLMIKPPRSTGPVRVSYAPTAITDIPITVADALGVPHALPGESALKLADDATRVRSFGMYSWENEDWRASYFEYLDLMEIRGRLRDGNSWALRDSLYAPGGDDSARARGLHDPQRSSTGVAYRWSRPKNFLHAPEGAKGFEMAIRSVASKPQTVTIQDGDRLLQTLTLRDQSWVTVRHRLQPSTDPSGHWIVMTVDPPWRVRGDPRRLGVMTRDLKWTP
jgi:hypothetical protein